MFGFFPMERAFDEIPHSPVGGKRGQGEIRVQERYPWPQAFVTGACGPCCGDGKRGNFRGHEGCNEPGPNRPWQGIGQGMWQAKRQGPKTDQHR